MSQVHPNKFRENHKITMDRPNALNNILRGLKYELANNFEYYWDNEISTLTSKNPSGGRLALFSHIKLNFGFENNLNTIKNSKHRHPLNTKLRIGSHKLASETRRHNNIPRGQRKCLSCKQSGEIEDEFHFLFSCHKHSNKREDMFDFILSTDTEFSKLSDMDKLT
jgi:hypothetical protein